jgi:hypothetical protein
MTLMRGVLKLPRDIHVKAVEDIEGGVKRPLKNVAIG